MVIGKDERLELKFKDQTIAVKPDGLAAEVRRAQAQPQAGDQGTVGGVALGTAVVISADKSVQYERVVKVMDILQRAGVQRVGLSVQLAP